MYDMSLTICHNSPAPNYGSCVPVDTAPGPVLVYRAPKSLPLIPAVKTSSWNLSLRIHSDVTPRQEALSGPQHELHRLTQICIHCRTKHCAEVQKNTEADANMYRMSNQQALNTGTLPEVVSQKNPSSCTPERHRTSGCQIRGAIEIMSACQVRTDFRVRVPPSRRKFVKHPTPP